MFKHYWKVLCRVVLFIGILLSFFAIIELLRVYQTLSDAHPALGVSFLVILICGVIWLSGYIVFVFVSRPPVLIPPSIRDVHTASIEELKRYCKYLVKYMMRLEKNEGLEPDGRRRAIDNQAELKHILETGQSSIEVLVDGLQRAEEAIESLVATLDEKAEREIRHCVRDVMLGVALSPYRAVDLLIVLYRNTRMVIQVVSIYNSRPRFREQVSIFLDAMKIVATVNFLNFGSKLLEKLCSGLPFMGRVMDDVAQGIGAGLLTSVAGHAASYRCRAFRRWDEEQAVQNVRSCLKSFINDVKDIFMKDVVPHMKSHVYSEVPREKVEKPGSWENMCKGISSAIDTTGEVAEDFVRIPIRTGQKVVYTGGKVAWGGVVKTSKFLGKGIKGAGKGIRFIASSSLGGLRGVGRFSKKALHRGDKGGQDDEPS